MKKEVIASTCTFLAICLVGYIAFSAINVSFNISEWSRDDRTQMVLFDLILGAIGFGICYVIIYNLGYVEHRSYDD